MASRRRRLYSAATMIALPGALTLGAMAVPTTAHAQAAGADLRIISPRAGDALGNNAFSMEVAFQAQAKSPVTAAELWVDGVRWAHRDFETPQYRNILSFAVDATTLPEGTHTVVVKVFTSGGGVSQTSLQVAAGDSNGVTEGSPNGPSLSFPNLPSGKHVMGNVELLLDAPARGGLNPYVSIYVDKQFKTLKNYPPYSYTWDTTQVSNGYHTIEATGYLDSANASTTRRIQVYVDNPGGNTKINKDIADLSVPSASAAKSTAAHLPLPKRVVGVTSVTSRVRPAAAVASPVLRPVGTPTLSARTTVSPTDAPAVVAAGMKTIAHSGLLHPLPSDLPLYAPAVPGGRDIPALRHTARPAPRVAIPTLNAATATTIPATALDVASAPMHTVRTPSVRVAPATPRFKAPFALQSRVAVHAPLAPAASSVLLHPHRTMSHRATRIAVAPSSLALLKMPGGKSFDVAFNGQQIAFDVPPRVEAGLPLAPFRQIFEHTGGQVQWVSGSHVVRAINADREVIITVGKNTATVNGKSYTMARPAFVEQGRTIVPLSFVGQAMNVNVSYDPATGHLQITSK